MTQNETDGDAEKPREMFPALNPWIPLRLWCIDSTTGIHRGNTRLPIDGRVAKDLALSYTLHC